ncbi:hypothetical protein LFM09_11545 [Lentzea alba]|uniref:hypothetical protein n=1 Tax=Lentzea alba TaxID=2714351 RepID=UPI0039BEDC23
MSTTRCATVIMRVLVRSRVASALLTALDLLLDTNHVLVAVIVVLTEIAVALSSQPRPVTGHPGREVTTYRATNAASSACTS